MGLFEKWRERRERKRQEKEQAQKELVERQREEKYREKMRYRFPTIDFDPLPGCSQFEYPAVGESFHKKEIASLGYENPDYKLAKGELYKRGYYEKPVYAYYFPKLEATLQPEPDNKHDPNAIMVLVRGIHVGYIRRTDCPAIKAMLDAGRIRRVQASIRGGDSRMIYTEMAYPPEERIPISDLRIDRDTSDFSVTLFIDARP